jgi:hypothetical protein
MLDAAYNPRRVQTVATGNFVMSVCLSVRPRVITRLPLEEFSWNLIFEYFSKICPVNSSFIQIYQELRVHHMNNYVYLWKYLTEFFIEWEIFQIKVVEKIKTHILDSITFPRKSRSLWGNVGNWGRVKQAT